MKKLMILFAAVFMFAATNVMAQDPDPDTETVDMTVVLQDVLDLNVTAGSSIVFTFDTPAEWTSGMTAPDGGTVTTITIDATADWFLTIAAAHLTDGGGNTMEADNVGVYCTATGNHTFGNEVTSSYTSSATALGLDPTEELLIENGTGNAGDATDNAFTLNWECGTGNGTMNGTNMLDHVAAGDFPTGTYTTTVNLTLEAY